MACPGSSDASARDWAGVWWSSLIVEPSFVVNGSVSASDRSSTRAMVRVRPPLAGVCLGRERLLDALEPRHELFALLGIELPLVGLGTVHEDGHDE